jgi:acyl-CoA thioester hydrolase
MQIYQHQLTVTQGDLDELNHVNNVRYLQWVQDAAKAHWLEKTSIQLQEAYYWVVVSHHINYKAQALLNDAIIIKTFVTESKGVTSMRVVEIYHQKTSKLLVSCESKWCLMHRDTNRPTRITPEIATLFS